MTRIDRTLTLVLVLLAPVTAVAESDHLAGLIVKDLDKIQPPATYTVDTEFGAVTCELKKAKFLLVEAEKNAGDDPRGENPGQFVCYTAKCTDPPTEGVTEADDQFGAHSLDRKKIKIVCAPMADPAACGNNVTEGTEACDGTDDDACPGFCESDCTCGAAPEVCCDYTSSEVCSGGQTASQCTASGGVPGTSTDFCGDGGDCSATIAGPGACCHIEGEPDGCIQPVSEFDCSMLFGGQYLVGQICSAAGSCIDPKFIFVTSTTHTGNLGGLAGADSICQARAAAGGLPGTYRAWLSLPGTDAADRMTHATGPYMRWDGTVVADNWDDLVDGTLDAPINLSEAGTLVSPANVWTATTSSGTYSAVAGSCASWTTTISADTAVIGVASEVDSSWTQGATNVCSSANRLYCVEQ
jgi:hypothetical protein